MDMIKAGTIGVIAILFAVSLKAYKAEYGLYVALAVCLIILEYIMRYFLQILSGMEVLRGYLQDHYGYLSLLLKAVGATYACEFCAGICRCRLWRCCRADGDAGKGLYPVDGAADFDLSDGEHTEHRRIGGCGQAETIDGQSGRRNCFGDRRERSIVGTDGFGWRYKGF